MSSGSKRLTFMEMLLKSVGPPGDHWIWQGYVMPNGYPMFGSVPAYRRAWEDLVGPIPYGFELDHLCKTPMCVNPNHLEPVTPRENKLRSDCPSALNSRKTECDHGHAFDTANTYLRRNKKTGRLDRMCKTCRRLNMRKLVRARRRETTEADGPII